MRLDTLHVYLPASKIPAEATFQILGMCWEGGRLGEILRACDGSLAWVSRQRGVIFVSWVGFLGSERIAAGQEPEAEAVPPHQPRPGVGYTPKRRSPRLSNHLQTSALATLQSGGAPGCHDGKSRS